MAVSGTCAAIASSAAASNRAPMPTPQKNANKYFVPMTSAAVCAVCRAPSASRATPSRLGLKKVTDLPALCETLLEVEDPVLELDELWSFVLKKARKRWVWIALCRQTRQIVAFVIGDRSEKTCLRLWKAIAEGLSLRSVLHGFVESVLKSVARHATHGGG